MLNILFDGIHKFDIYIEKKQIYTATDGVVANECYTMCKFWPIAVASNVLFKVFVEINRGPYIVLYVMFVNEFNTQ